jgi:hypothetical protein
LQDSRESKNIGFIMGERREQRIKASIPVVIRGMDANGAMFDLNVTTMDITPQGARLTGVTVPLLSGATLNVHRGASKARFRVTWVGQLGSPEQNQIGVRSLEPARYIWGVALERQMGDEYAGGRRIGKDSPQPGDERKHSKPKPPRS